MVVQFFSIFILFAFDRFIKYFVVKTPWDGVVLIPRVLKIELHKNFGVIANFPLPRFFIIAVSALIIAFLIFYFFKSSNKKTKITLSLILAGALSNLIDRVFFGYVVDYALLFNISYINISDLLIFLGILFIIV